MTMAGLFHVKTLTFLCLVLLFGVSKIECGLRGRILDEYKVVLDEVKGDKVVPDKNKGDKSVPDEDEGDKGAPEEDQGDKGAPEEDKGSPDDVKGDKGALNKDNVDKGVLGQDKSDPETSDDSITSDKGDPEVSGDSTTGKGTLDQDKGDSEASGDSATGDKDDLETNGDSAKGDKGALGEEKGNPKASGGSATDDKGDLEASGGSGTIFDVTKYGAIGDGKKDNTQAFMQAWVAACKNGAGPATVRVPSGNFVLGPVVFQGPCKGTITVEVAGTVIATTDLSDYSEDSWILFERVTGVVLTGGGTFNGKGASAWPYNSCKKSSSTCNLPTSIKFIHVTNAVVHDIKSVDSKFFHFHVTDSSGFKAYNVTIVAPAESPNTDGIHISDTDKISITNSHIGTGDDCISIGQGVADCDISNVFCGPGHGISVGSLGKRQNEADVNGITVTDCTLSNTDNGVRIKTFAGSPPGIAAAIHFSNIAMEKVKNPIIIDQFYGGNKNSGSPSRVKLTDVIFSNIHGTSVSDVAVSLLCSSAFPCPVQMEDINLTFDGGKTATSECSNAKITYKGKQNPSPCK